MDDLCIIYCRGDAEEWFKYIKDNCRKSNPGLRIQARNSSDTRWQRRGAHDVPPYDARIFVVVATPELLDWLISDTDAVLKTFVTNPNKAVLFYCGTSKSEFKQTSNSSAKPLCEKFVKFDEWRSFDHTSAEAMVEFIVGELRRNQPATCSKSVTILPLELTCEVRFSTEST